MFADYAERLQANGRLIKKKRARKNRKKKNKNSREAGYLVQACSKHRGWVEANSSRFKERLTRNPSVEEEGRRSGKMSEKSNWA